MSSAELTPSSVNLPVRPQLAVISADARRKTTALKGLLQSPQTEFILEAHNGLSAKIVEEAGFDGIWASGLSISAQLGVRDNNEASWTQVLEVVEFMSDNTTIPILLDGDTGYGNFNNMRRLVHKLQQRQIAGVCIEDKLFPKTNSFIAGEAQPLADVDEFCGKIKAGKDAQTDDDFCIVARVEALIAGHGLAEALKRAEAYRQAGADAILMHSKLKKADEIVQFCREWGGRGPVVIVPTKYYSTPTEVFRRSGVSLVIWANHVLRASIWAMQRVAATVRREQTLVNVEDKVAPLQEVFRLQGADELNEAEKKYFRTAKSANAIVLAASRGSELGELTRDRPKCMLPVLGKPLLAQLVEGLRSAAVREIDVVAGYKADQVQVAGIRLHENLDYESTSELASLACALDRMAGPTIISYGDVLFRRYVFGDLLERSEEIVLVVDSTVSRADVGSDCVRCTAPDSHSVFDQPIQLDVFVDTGDVHGQWTGLMKVGPQGAQWVREAMQRLHTRCDFAQLQLRDLAAELQAVGHPVHVMYISGHWINVNRLQDVDDASSFAGEL